MSDNCVCCDSAVSSSDAIHGVDRLEGLPGEFSVEICPKCGTGRTYPVVSELELAAFYPEEYSPYIDAENPTGFLAPIKASIRRQLEARTMQRMPFIELKGARGDALDVGCGRGDLGAKLIAAGWNVAGVEPAENACEHARAKGVDALHGTLGSVEFDDRKFDAVSFQHSLEHVFDPRVDLRLIHGITRPGARLLITVPNFGSTHRKLFCGRWFHLDLPRHRFHYTPEGLTKLVESAGFKVDRVTTATSVIGLPASLSYALLGSWRFGGVAGQRLISYSGLLLYPVAYLLSRISGGDYLHVVATRN